ncbi:hypothetical protein QTO05_08960 [Vibrio fortis]|uniref:hypothetical protein n=1 Tax=Vibrio fortis TaxID=212667 RepID=UPI002F429E22
MESSKEIPEQVKGWNWGVLFAAIFTISMNSSFEESGSAKLALRTLELSDKFHENIGTPYDIDLIQGIIRVHL